MPGKGGGTPRKASSVSSYCAFYNSPWPFLPFSRNGLGQVERQEKRGEQPTTRETKGRECVAGLVMKKHRVRVGLALGSVGRGDGVNDRLGFFVADF